MASNPVVYTDRQSAVQKAAIFYQSCFGVLKHDFNHLQLVKDSLIDFGVFWPEISNKSNVLKIFFSMALAWNWGSPVHFYVNRPGILEAKPAVLFGATMKKAEAMQASEKTYYQRFFEKLVEDFSRPRAKALSYAEHELIESRLLQRLRNVYWMKNSTTMMHASVEEVIALCKHTIERTDWEHQLKAYFSSTSGSFDEYSVTIYNIDFFAAFFQMLLSDGESYIAYYVGWCVVQVASQLATKDLIEHSYPSKHEASTGHRKLCSAMTLSYIGLPFYAGHINRKIQLLTVSRAHKIFKNAMAAFQTALRRSDFKAHLAIFSELGIGNETSILDLLRRGNDSVLDSKYVHFPDMNTDVWHNIKAATIARRITEVNETLLDYIDVDLQPTYRLRRQHFELLPIAFEAPFYDDDTIAAANYGALGSEMASGFAALIFKQISMSGNDTLTKLEEAASCFATFKPTSTATSHSLWEKKHSELLVRATALRMTYHAYFAGDRDWGDYRLPRYPQLTDKQLLFIFSCLLQCGKPDAQFKCNGPLETLRSFGSAFGCAPGDPMHSGSDCAVLI